MQIVQVKPGTDRQALADMARYMGMRVGIQGGMQVLIADSLNMGSSHPNNSDRNASTLRLVPISND